MSFLYRHRPWITSRSNISWSACRSLSSSSDQNRLRRNAAQLLAVWLRTEPTYHEAALQKLQITQQNSLYFDNIPSFVRTLKEGPPIDLHGILDHMVGAGLANPELTLNYRNFDKTMATKDRLKLRLKEHTERIEYIAKQEVELRQQLEREKNIALPGIETDRMSHLEKQVNSLKSEKSDLDIRSKRIKKQLDEIDATISEEKIKEINALMASVRDTTVSVFCRHVAEKNAQLLQQFQSLDAHTDLTRPHDWFLRARFDRRKIIFHGGPTNSGKTYSALERLKQAKTGIYLGPLRLLAAEVYEKLTISGVYCNLLTGQESREIPFATHSAATVEMANSTQDYDVVVIDEIQMIADDERGFAWTRALLGCRCPEIHVCGGLEAVGVVRRLVEACGDEFELKTYERFSDLVIANRALARKPDELGTYSRVQKGDCVVAFSRNDIFAIKREIESSTDHKCCIIYGSLPPTTRSEQARRFNDPDSGYDVLVASDAIGMGLNLNIKRIIFNSIYKYDGNGVIRLGHSAMKQISGRAGRRNSPYPNGEVLTRDPRDMDYLVQCLTTDIKPIEKAGLVPTEQHIETFSETLEEYGLGSGKMELHNILERFKEMANVKSDYFLCRQTEMLETAGHLAGIDLSIPDKYLLCLCPMHIDDRGSLLLMKRFASKLAAGEVCGLNQYTIPKPPRNFEDLAHLCKLFSELELFLWLQRRFPPGNIMEQQAANSRREETIQLIAKGLANSDKLTLKHCYVQRDKDHRGKWELLEKRKRRKQERKHVKIVEDEWH